MRLNPRSVRFRTTTGATVALAVLLTASGFLINWFVEREIRQAFDETLLAQALDRAALIDEGAPASGLADAVGEEVVVVVVSPDGEIVAAAGTPRPDLFVDQAIGLAEDRLPIFERGDEEAHDERVRVATAEAADGSRVVVASEEELARKATGSVRTILMLGVPVLTVATAAIAWFVTGRALAPVARMRSDLREIRGVAGRRIIEPPTADEIAELATGMNEVLDRLDAQSEARRRFVADASHELKSPLANARAITETGADDPASRAAVLNELDRLQLLVDDLLFLARTDETTPPEASQFDLDDVIFDEAERAAAATDKIIDASGVSPARVLGDKREVARAIRNLLENGVRHAEARVAVSTASDDTDCVFIVTDDGPGIAPDDRHVVFDRFVRLDPDRTRSDGGTGLGLSIVASIAARAGGSVELADSPDGGARFELRLPQVR